MWRKIQLCVLDIRCYAEEMLDVWSFFISLAALTIAIIANL